MFLDGLRLLVHHKALHKTVADIGQTRNKHCLVLPAQRIVHTVHPLRNVVRQAVERSARLSLLRTMFRCIFTRLTFKALIKVFLTTRNAKQERNGREKKVQSQHIKLIYK